MLLIAVAIFHIAPPNESLRLTLRFHDEAWLRAVSCTFLDALVTSNKKIKEYTLFHLYGANRLLSHLDK